MLSKSFCEVMEIQSVQFGLHVEFHLAAYCSVERVFLL